MSRTYRRTRGEKGWSLDWALKPDRLESNYPHLTREDAVKTEMARYHADGGWNMTTPMWWIREFMTVPQRAEVRGLLRKVVKMELDNLIDYPVFPLAKKPHHYFW
jgi:hypothetical protein